MYQIKGDTMRTIDVNATISVYAENEEEAIDILTEVFEAESAIESYHFKTQEVAV